MGISTPINVRQENSAGAGAKDWISLNTFARPTFTLNLIIDGTATVNIEGTLVNPNRDTVEAEDVFVLQDWSSISATTAGTVNEQPITAIRVNQTAGTGSTILQALQAGN